MGGKCFRDLEIVKSEEQQQQEEEQQQQQQKEVEEQEQEEQKEQKELKEEQQQQEEEEQQQQLQLEEEEEEQQQQQQELEEEEQQQQQQQQEMEEEEEEQKQQEQEVEEVEEVEEQEQEEEFEMVNKEFGKYRAIEYIGGGKCRDVYKCLDRLTGNIVVYESLPIVWERWDGTVALSKIYFRLGNINKHHANVARYLGKNTLSSTLGLVFEYLTTDLKKYITISNISTRPHVIKRFMAQILLGVAFCHKYGIYHQDLKPENFMVGFEVGGRVKLANFGLAKVSDDYLCYRAPELLLGVNIQYSEVADMWSIGCIFAEMLTQSALFNAETPRDQLISIFSLLGTPTEETWPGIKPYLRTSNMENSNFEPQNLATKFTRLDAYGIDFLSRMLCLDPKKRITTAYALRHDYFIRPRH